MTESYNVLHLRKAIIYKELFINRVCIQNMNLPWIFSKTLPYIFKY